MNQKLPEEDVIRRYLLGALDEPELSEIEQKLRNSEELRETAELIEDEIIEQYLEKSLDERDKMAVETHFLHLPEHREKLWFAGLLWHRLKNESPAKEETVLIRPTPIYRWRFAGAFAATAAVTAVLSASVTYLTLSKKLDDSHRAEAAAREQSARLQEKLDDRRQAFLVKLDLRPGVSRSAGSDIPEIRIHKATDLIKVDVLLLDPTQDTYHVALHETGKKREIWSQSDVKTISEAPFSRLKFYVPTQPIKSGAYDLVVTSESRAGLADVYPFDLVGQ